MSIKRGSALIGLALILSACNQPFDFDLRKTMGGSVNTGPGAAPETLDRPAPDSRGVITYPTYQVAVARRGDRLVDMAQRLGIDTHSLSELNGVGPHETLRQGQIIALPQRVGQVSGSDQVDVSTLDGDTARQVQSDGFRPIEPIRHTVARGETAFSIARSFGISPRALAQWNGLDNNFSIHEGQVLLIPPLDPTSGKPAEDMALPGDGSRAPAPPSASLPLPADNTANAPSINPDTPIADIGQGQSNATGAPMIMPVDGAIIRDYVKGRNEGIDIAAASGTPIKAASSGQVVNVSTTADGVKFLLIRHPGELITVYTHVEDITVAKGDAVSRGQTIAHIRNNEPAFVHFEVRKGLDSTDPMPFLQR